MIPFNKPYLTGNEVNYIQDTIQLGQLSGDNKYTQLCQVFFQDEYKFKKCLLTTSCTTALEMAAILLDIQPGDEIIMPSYTFVSAANAFILRGANVVFADSNKDNPNIDADTIESLITPKTKAIVPVHYAGVACDMDKIMEIAARHNLYVIEDAAHAIDSFYTGKDNIKRALGSIGHMGAFSFHATKNITSGEGGMLTINDEAFSARADIIWQKGTNRAAFFRGEVAKYEWVDLGSSFLPAEIIAAFLWAQVGELEKIQNKRKHIWQTYFDGLSGLENSANLKLPVLPDYAFNNAHMFYFVCESLEHRTALITKLKKNNVAANFHYLSLHASPFYHKKHDGRNLPFSDLYSDTLLRLPMYYDLSDENIQFIIKAIKNS